MRADLRLHLRQHLRPDHLQRDLCPDLRPDLRQHLRTEHLQFNLRGDLLGGITVTAYLIPHGAVLLETVGMHDSPLDAEGKFTEQLVLCRKGDDYPLLPPERIDFMDVAPEQLVSIAAAD